MLSYQGDGPVLTCDALVCVRLVVRVKSGTFCVDKRHDSASMTSITGGESFSSFIICLKIDSVFLCVPIVSFIMSTRTEWCSSARN